MTKLVFTFYLVCLSFQTYTQNYQITWQQCLGGSEIDYAMDIVKINDNYLMAGICTSDDGDITYTHGNGDGWVIMIDSTGNILWQRNYGGSLGDWFVKIVPTDNDEFYLIGLSGSSDYDISFDPYPGSYDYWIVKIDLEGNIIWDRIVGGNSGETIWSGFGTSDGGVVAYGWTDSDDGDVSQYYGLSDSWMIKISSDGEIEWDYTIGTDWVDVGQAAMQTSDGGYLIGCNADMLGNNTGNITCTPHSTGFMEAVLFKLDSNLNLEWQHCYGGSDDDGITALMEVSDGYVFGAFTRSNDGDVSGLHGESDIWIVKIDFVGNVVWQNPLGGSRSEYIPTLLKTEDENIIIPGYTRSNNGDVTGNHSMSEYDYDIWFVKLSSEGELLSQQCIGGAGSEELYFGVVKKSDNNFVIAGYTDYGPSYDVACAPHGDLGTDKDWWVFEIKDCSQYPVGNLQTPTGPDTTCTVYDSTNAYAIGPATGAWYYEWRLIPEDAGTINGNGLQATTTWTTGWEGQASLQVRAMNDCDTSEWSEPCYTEVFTCLGMEELSAGNIKLKVYPNPARGFVVFEFSATVINSVVIPNHGAGQGGGARKPPANMDPASKPQGTSIGSNGKGVSHAGAQSRAQGFDMTTKEGAVVAIVDVFGQRVAQLPIATEKTIWQTDEVENGIYFYRVEIEGDVLSGKVVIQK